MKRISLLSILLFKSITPFQSDNNTPNRGHFSMKDTPQASKAELNEFLQLKKEGTSRTRRPTANKSREEARTDDNNNLERAKNNTGWYTKAAGAGIVAIGIIALIIKSTR